MGSASRHSCVWRAVHHGGLIRCIRRQRNNVRSVATASATISFGFRCVSHTPLIDHPETVRRTAELGEPPALAVQLGTAQGQPRELHRSDPPVSVSAARGDCVTALLQSTLWLLSNARCEKLGTRR